MQEDLSEKRTGIDRDQAMQQGRKDKGMLPAAESVPNRHHLASQAQMDDKKTDAAKEQDEKNRLLSVSSLIDILKMKYGRDDIHEGNLIPVLCDIFGEDASPTLKNIAKFGWDSEGDESEGHAGSLDQQVIDLAKMDALVTGPAEIGKLKEEKEALEAEIKGIKLKRKQ